MTYLRKSLQVVAGTGQAGGSLKYHRAAQASVPAPAALLLALLMCLPGMALAETATEPPAVAAATQAQLININTADAATLAAGLRGVGVSRAEDIIRYRETYGPFSAVEELVDVKGIGQATLDKNLAVITLE